MNDLSTRQLSRSARIARLLTLACLAALGVAPARAAVQLSTLTAATEPIAFVDPDDGLPHRFVVEHAGRILVLDPSGLRATPFLDLRLAAPPGQQKVLWGGAGSEQGLLAMAVDPGYRQNGFFYLYYTSRNWDGAGPIASGDIVVERYQRSVGDVHVADPSTAQVVIYIPHRDAGNHNGGWLAFGPDADLYISTGDGGGGCDSTGPAAGVGDPLFPHGNAWRYDVSHYSPAATHPGEYLLGKLLRLDVSGDDFPADPLRNYAIPPTNPYFGVFGADEIWARGLRNPFRFSFDRQTGDLWIGDVGQNKWEEIDFLPAGAAVDRHFGWGCREGLVASSVSPSNCTQGNCPATSAGLLDPLRVEDHNNGWCSLLGGYRYRGSRISSLAAAYLYSDNCKDEIWKGTFNGSIWSFAATGITGANGTYSFAEDHLGEIYVVSGGSGVVACLHDGTGCFWSLWTGFGEDGFEAGTLGRWSATSP